MIPLITFIIGLIFGWIRSVRKNGALLDHLQYSVVHGLAFGIIGLVVSIVLIQLIQ